MFLFMETLKNLWSINSNLKYVDEMDSNHKKSNENIKDVLKCCFGSQHTIEVLAITHNNANLCSTFLKSPLHVS